MTIFQLIKMRIDERQADKKVDNFSLFEFGCSLMQTFSVGLCFDLKKLFEICILSI